MRSEETTTESNKDYSFPGSSAPPAQVSRKRHEPGFSLQRSLEESEEMVHRSLRQGQMPTSIRYDENSMFSAVGSQALQI